MGACGVKEAVLFSCAAPDVYAFLTDSVLAMTNVSGPAAASKPFADETLSRDAVEEGSLSAGHDCGRRRSLVSPAIARKPRVYDSQSLLHYLVTSTYLCLNFFEIWTCSRLRSGICGLRRSIAKTPRHLVEKVSSDRARQN